MKLNWKLGNLRKELTSNPSQSLLSINLGILVILAVIFSGVLLSRENKKIDVYAVSAGACNCNDSHGNPVPGSCSGSSCDCGSLEVRNNRCDEAPGGGVVDDPNNPNDGCGFSEIRCRSVDAQNRSYSFCIASDGSDGTCNDAAVDQGYVVLVGSSNTGNYGNQTYFCPQSHPSGVRLRPRSWRRPK